VLILGITTSTNQVGCAIGGHEGVLAQVHSARGKRHAESLAPSIDFVRQQARIDLDEIGCVAVDVGPGLFTGLRVGIAAGKAMAHALRVPMVGVASLDLVAFPVRWSPRVPPGSGRHPAPVRLPGGHARRPGGRPRVDR
jgi:tRNA threonylcarbamoyladenosine biosynthesis protein TsaB